MNYVKICPKCKSTITKRVFDRKKMRFVSKCLNCLFVGDELFEDIPVEDLKVKEIGSFDNTKRKNRR